MRLRIRLEAAQTLHRLVATISSLVVLVSAVNCQSSGQSSKDDIPDFSANAATIYHYGQRSKTATSPDGKKKVSIELLSDDNFRARITVVTENGEQSAIIRFGLNAQVLWSPDSLAFALTGSCCGANGQYETDVFYLQKESLERVKLTALVENAFGHPVKCGWPEPPNIAAIKWLLPSKNLLIAAEIIHHSNCDSFGTFKGYVVDLTTPRVVRVMDQLEVKKRFHSDLGEELLQSDDVCIRHPESCRVGSYHQ